MAGGSKALWAALAAGATVAGGTAYYLYRRKQKAIAAGVAGATKTLPKLIGEAKAVRSAVSTGTKVSTGTLQVVSLTEDMPGWLGMLISHGHLTQAYFVAYLYEHVHIGPDHYADAPGFENDNNHNVPAQDDSKLWCRRMALWPPPMNGGTGSKGLPSFAKEWVVGGIWSDEEEDRYGMPDSVSNPVHSLYKLKAGDSISDHFQAWVRKAADRAMFVSEDKDYWGFGSSEVSYVVDVGGASYSQQQADLALTAAEDYMKAKALLFIAQGSGNQNDIWKYTKAMQDALEEYNQRCPYAEGTLLPVPCDSITEYYAKHHVLAKKTTAPAATTIDPHGPTWSSWKGKWPTLSPADSLRLFEYYKTAAWLVWAAEAWRIHAGEYFATGSGFGREWRNHCLAWGVGCASKDTCGSRKTNRASGSPGSWLRIDKAVYGVEEMLRKVMLHTPPPGSLPTGTELQGRRLCNWSSVTGSMRPMWHLPDGWAKALTAKALEEQSNDWVHKYYIPALTSVMMAVGTYITSGVGAVAGAATSAAITATGTSAATTLAANVAASLVSKCITAAFKVAVAFARTGDVSTTQFLPVIQSVVLESATGVAEQLNMSLPDAQQWLKSSISTMETTWGYTEALIGSVTEVPELSDITKAILSGEGH